MQRPLTPIIDKATRSSTAPETPSGYKHIHRDLLPKTLSHESMSTPSKPPLLFEALSIELWERIFLFTSPQDILRLSMVRNILDIPPFRAFANREVFERSTALAMNLHRHLLQFNTKSTFLLSG